MFVITGAAGFIGSVLSNTLAQNYPDQELIVVDFLQTGDDRWSNLDIADQNGSIYSRIDPQNIIQTLDTHRDDIRCVFHMGANSDTAASEEDAKKWNLDYSKELSMWCASHNVPLIYASSAATYGNGECGYVDNESLDYLEKLKPLNAYGRSKNDFDKWLVSRLKKEQPPQWVGLKFFNVYGPNEWHKGRMASVVLHGFNNIQNSGEIKLFQSHKEGIADGEQKRDFVFVKDVVRAMIWFYEHPSVSGLFNQGTGQARSFLDLARATFAAVGVDEKVSFIPTPEKFRAQYQYFTQADMTKFKTVTQGNFNFTALEDGVKDYVCNYLLPKSQSL